MIFASIIGIANYSIYMATIDYMITAYGPYSASATGGNGWSRDFLGRHPHHPRHTILHQHRWRPPAPAGSLNHSLLYLVRARHSRIRDLLERSSITGALPVRTAGQISGRSK